MLTEVHPMWSVPNPTQVAAEQGVAFGGGLFVQLTVSIMTKPGISQASCGNPDKGRGLYFGGDCQVQKNPSK